MPFYQYTATDNAGKGQQGTIQATTAGEALHLLKSRGLSAVRIIGERAGNAPPVPAQRVQPAPVRPPPSNVQINVPAATQQQIHRSRKSSDKDLFFLFSQIAEQLRAGIGPVQVFSELSRIYKDPKYSDSLGMVAAAAAEGKAISSVLAQWPDLYPEHVVGLVRAGEAGGFLPEATSTISEQAGNAYKFKRFHWWIWALAINALLSIPGVFMFRHSLLKYYEEEMASGGANKSLFGVFTEMGHLLLWPWGPIIIALCALSWGLRNYFSTRGMRRMRHQLGLKMPVLGARARNESVTIFAWVLGKLAKGGVAPNRSWEMAVASVPNIAMQDKLKNAGSIMNEGSRLSDIVFKSNLFPQEYAPMIATGELTGNISGALERLSNVSRTEYEAGTIKSKLFTGSLGCTALLITLGVTTIVIAWVINREIYGRVLDDMSDQTTSAPANPSPSSDPSSTE